MNILRITVKRSILGAKEDNLPLSKPGWEVVSEWNQKLNGGFINQVVYILSRYAYITV